MSAFTLEERQALAAQLPWVAADPRGLTRCEAIKGSAPGQAWWDRKTGLRVPDDDPVRLKHRCTFAAKWVYVYEHGRVARYCWNHLLAHGMGSMEESARVHAWDQAHIEEFMSAIDEADEGTKPGPDDTAETLTWRQGYVMGLCMGASIAGMPKSVWASPERHGRLS